MFLKEFDNQFYNENVQFLAGVDEAGRGPLAGPVIAACAVFSQNTFIDGINDSKQLSAKKREYLFNLIIEKAVEVKIEVISVQEIEEMNILRASLFGMQKSIEKCSNKIDLILVDGNQSFKTQIPLKTIVKGDEKSFVIAAASILAKVTRDKIMAELSKSFPKYHWDKNKGYGTKQHIEAIREFGVTEHHRKKFLRKIID